MRTSSLRFTITFLAVCSIVSLSQSKTGLTHGKYSSRTSQTHAAQIDVLMRQLFERGQFNGSVLVVEHDEVIYKHGLGVADASRKLPFTSRTPTYLASLSKQFTAMAIMMLVERHQLSYSDSLSKFFPQFPAYAEKITIRHLLNHTSGIPDYVGLGLEHPGLTNAEVLQALTREQLRFAPGEKFAYSNSGYVLLAMIIEKVSGQSYPTFITRNIFAPLGMHDTFVSQSRTHDDKLEARAYNRFGDLDDYNLNTFGEGGIYSTAEDLFKWDRALYTDKLVKQVTLSEAFRPAKLNDDSTSPYGFGWALATYKNEPIVAHAGRFGGFNTYIKRLLKDHSAIIFLTNKGFRNMGAIGNALLSILSDEPYELPKLSSAETIYKTYQSSGVGPAIAEYKSLKKRDGQSYDFSESELNELGYELLNMGKTTDAIEILKLNVEAYPDSANVYDGLGEAYMKHGDRELAIKNYNKSLQLDPSNANAAAMLKRLEKN